MKVILSVISLCFYCSFLAAADPKGSPPEENVNSKKHASDYITLGYTEYNKGNHAKAFEWFMKAAEQGDATAQDNIGLMYYVGEGVLQDYKQAFKWFMKAAEQGDAEAQYNLGVMYKDGTGVLQDYKQAFKWFMKAAEQGHAKAQYNLGFMYRNGKGVLQDYKQALKWNTKAAEQGDAGAQNNLGVMHALGQGVLKDTVTAYSWANIAAANGLSPKLRELLTKEMTPEQIAEGQKLSREMVKANPKLLGN